MDSLLKATPNTDELLDWRVEQNNYVKWVLLSSFEEEEELR